MYRPRRAMIQVAILLLLLSGFAALVGFGSGMASSHATCCVIMPPINVELERLASEGVIDVDRAAASMKLPAWSQPKSTDASSAEARQEYERDTMRRLSFVIGDVPAKEWSDSKLAASKMFFAFAAVGFVACVLTAYRASCMPKVLATATPEQWAALNAMSKPTS